MLFRSKGVVAVSAIKVVVAFSAFQDVIAAFAVKRVIARATIEMIVSSITVDLVVTLRADLNPPVDFFNVPARAVGKLDLVDRVG